MNEELNKAQLNVDISLRESNDYDELELNFLTGDAAKPQGPKDQNCIIINCVDNSGEWSFGGFFKSISKLSPIPEEAYKLAAEMDDLELGSVQFLEIGERDNLVVDESQDSGDLGGKEEEMKTEETSTTDTNTNKSESTSTSTTSSSSQSEKKSPRIFVANVIAQERKRNKISGIQVPALQKALDIIALKCLELKATVHSPRIGVNTPNFNWYSIERTFRSKYSNYFYLM